MLHVDVVVVSLHLLRIVGIHDSLLLIYFIVEDYFSINLLSRFWWRFIAMCVITDIFTLATMQSRVPRLHIAWIWAIIAIGARTFQGASKSLTAFLMFTTIMALIWSNQRLDKYLSSRPRMRGILLIVGGHIPILKPTRYIVNGPLKSFLEFVVPLCSSTAFALAGTVTEAWSVVFIAGVCFSIPSISLRYNNSDARVVIAFGWLLLLGWCMKVSSSFNDGDYEIFLLFIEVLISHLMAAYDIGIYFGFYLGIY
jgi:hypothetical protein